VALGDRCFARPPALRQILDAGADFIVRTGWTRLRLAEADGTPVAWEPSFTALAPGEVAERAVTVEYAGTGGKGRGTPFFAARLIVLRLSPDAAERAAKAQHRRQSRCRPGKVLRPLTVQATGYLMLVTSLPAAVPAAAVLAAYRWRWQVELAFKRFEKPARLRPPAGQGRGARPRLVAGPSHPRPADRG
jgi:hypothetical protein